VELTTISPDEYIATVLPETIALWGGKRDFETYAHDFREVADSAYAKRRRFTVGIREGGAVACSCKLYDREMRWGDATLRATGIGAVFTPPQFRGRGYASAMLGALLDQERAAGRDLAFLFSDIHPLFYERLGFVKLPSRLLTVRAASLDGSPSGAVPLTDADWTGVRRCFDTLESARPWAFKRSPLVWNWVRRKLTAPSPPSTQPVNLAVKRDRAIVAYVIGRRVMREDAFVYDDFAFNGDAGRAVIPALMRAAAGDLARVSGWLPPPVAREALPRGSVRVRKDGITMFAALSSAAKTWMRTFAADIAASKADPVWPADHV
jgi:GNAT superfamily N-acetyltransferase